MFMKVLHGVTTLSNPIADLDKIALFFFIAIFDFIAYIAQNSQNSELPLYA